LAAARERTMSVATYLSSNTSKAIRSQLHRLVAAVGGQCVALIETIAEARMQRAMIEAEMYLNRYKHSSKNDDDLPVLR